ncbi:MAG TPA: hypothetical protein VIL38_09600 [Thermaerobacter sp.]
MRERLKPLMRVAALGLFVAIAVLWQRRTGGSVAGLLAGTVALAAGLLAAAAGFARWMTRLEARPGRSAAPVLVKDGRAAPKARAGTDAAGAVREPWPAGTRRAGAGGAGAAGRAGATGDGSGAVAEGLGAAGEGAAQATPSGEGWGRS